MKSKIGDRGDERVDAAGESLLALLGHRYWDGDEAAVV